MSNAQPVPSASDAADGDESVLVAHRQTRWAPPPGATEFVLVRHGASEPFVRDRPFPLFEGHGDPALDPDGREQAKLASRRLEGERVDAIYVTTLRRTLQTIEPYLKATGRSAEVERDLREIFLGEWEGGWVREHAMAGHPAYLKVLETGEWGHIPGAETTAQLRDRCVAALQRLHAKHPDQRVVCVVHGGVISALTAHAAGAHPRAFGGADNTSMHTIVVHGDLWQLRRFNDTTHLDHEVWAG